MSRAYAIIEASPTAGPPSLFKFGTKGEPGDARKPEDTGSCANSRTGTCRAGVVCPIRSSSTGGTGNAEPELCSTRTPGKREETAAGLATVEVVFSNSRVRCCPSMSSLRNILRRGAGIAEGETTSPKLLLIVKLRKGLINTFVQVLHIGRGKTYNEQQAKEVFYLMGACFPSRTTVQGH